VNNFFDKVKEETETVRKLHPRVINLHEGFAILLEEVEEFKAEVWKKESKRDLHNAYKELVQIASICNRIAEDLLEPKIKENPF